MGAGASASDQDKIAAYDAISSQLGALSKGGTVDVADVQKLLASSADDKAKAAGKLQAIQRGNSRRKEDAAGCGGGSIEEVFANFCKIYRVDQMTNTIFAKFCKDTKGVVDKKKFAAPQIDMVWSKAAGKHKKIGVDIFKQMLAAIADLKGVAPGDFEAFIISHAQVKNSGTQGESRFYDDKDTWTGVAVKGGPDTSLAKNDLSALADRDNKADVRGNIA
jgi:hypothetical protein